MILEQLKKWFRLSEKQSSRPCEPVAVGYHRLVDLPKEKTLNGWMIAVCRNGQLVLTKTAETPDKLNPNEVCWILPAGDVFLTVPLVIGEHTIQANVRIAFDPDHSLARFLYGCDKIEQADLVALVARQWQDLAELEQIAAEKLLNNSVAIARFRAHLSLLLQEHGLRCVGIDRLEIVESEEIIEAELVVPDEVSAELVQAVEDVKNDDQWDQFLDGLDAAGFELDVDTVQKLETLGEEYLQRKQSAREVASEIRTIMQRKNRDIVAIKQSNRFWDPAVLRLRLTGDEEKVVPENTGTTKIEILPKMMRRPSIWYIFRQTKIDETLQNYLQTALKEMENLLELIRNRENTIENKARLNDVRKTVLRLQDHTQTMPTLMPKPKTLRRKQRNIKELVKSVRRSTTSAGLAIGLLKKLAASNKTDENLQTDLAMTLQRLENEIVNRKNIYL